MNGFQQVLRLPSWNLCHSTTCLRIRATKTERVSCIDGVSFKAREFSNSVETKGKGDGEDTKEKNCDGLKNCDEEETDVEKEAWKLLQKALVTYCDTPIGTVAANDESDKGSPLNYDQVFIRDFVPSALAFLLKGEKEIVKNFLLHTLQLQVIIMHIFRIFFGVCMVIIMCSGRSQVCVTGYEIFCLNFLLYSIATELGENSGLL